jgi:hypothetical protein
MAFTSLALYYVLLCTIFLWGLGMIAFSQILIDMIEKLGKEKFAKYVIAISNQGYVYDIMGIYDNAVCFQEQIQDK